MILLPLQLYPGQQQEEVKQRRLICLAGQDVVGSAVGISERREDGALDAEGIVEGTCEAVGKTEGSKDAEGSVDGTCEGSQEGLSCGVSLG
jgi:hypothetical protein